ncbi:CHAT domain-containing protein [Rhodohalobacter halophilus]|uniref:CHAT domain-containing protein n=1 Tax=Rhodohalobacter halophilus TaxID=1812810 RepID=UPI00083F951F|nr:CHAT domain-containing protein [Rhodohalobacter halophilus]
MKHTAQPAHITPVFRSSYAFLVTVIATTIFSLHSTDVAAQSRSGLLNQFDEAVRAYHFEEPDRSKKIFKEIEPRICEDESLAELCVDVHLYQSLFYRNEWDLVNTEHHIERAYQTVLENLGEDHFKMAEVYVQYSYLYESQSELNTALEWSRKAISIADNYQEKKIVASQAYTSLGYVQDTAGDYEGALANYHTALEILEDANRGFELNRALSITHNNTGISHRKAGEFDKAIEHFEKALAAAIEAYGENHTEVALIYNGIGTYYYSIRDLGTATEYFKRTAATFEDAGETKSDRLARVYNNIGLIYMMMDELENGLNYLEQSQVIKVELFGTDHLETAVGYHNLASHYLANEKFDEAEENYVRSLQIRKNIYGENHPNLILPYTNMANLYIQSKRFEEAESALMKALEIGVDKLGEGHPEVLSIYAQLGEIYTEQGGLKEAEAFYQKAISILINSTYTPSGNSIDVNNVTYPVRFIEVTKSLGRLKMKLYREDADRNHLHEALNLFNFSAAAIDLLQTQYQSESSKLQLLDNYYTIFSTAADVYHELYELTGEDDWLAEMVNFMERGRARVAVELLQNVQARTFGGVPEDVLRDERLLNETVTRHFQELNVEKEKGVEADSGIIRSYEDSLFTSRRELIRFTNSLEQTYPSYYELKYDQTTATLSDIQEVLRSDETAIYYAFGEEKIYSIVVNKRSVGVAAMEEDGVKIRKRIDELREAVIEQNKHVYTQNAVSLYNLLIKPGADYIEGSSLLLFPDQSLHYLPFELLLTEDRSDHEYHQLPYLVNRYPIQYASSGTVLRAMKNQKPEIPRNLMAMAPFNESISRFDEVDMADKQRYFDELTPLPLTTYETNRISELFREKRSISDYIFPERVTVYQNTEATKKKLSDRSAMNYNFIHIASHAFVNESNPELSGILLREEDGESGVLYVSDIYNLQLNADLVVLGACETGLGDVHKGEGMIGFTRAFTYAGASNLMVSMWRVNDQNTSRLMIDFYQNIRSGKSYGEALRNAKLKLIQNPETANPIHWAAFVLNGR